MLSNNHNIKLIICIQLGILYFLKYLLSLVLGLIFLPAVVYIAVFSIHFWLLRTDGPGAFYHSSLFQTSLKG